MIIRHFFLSFKSIQANIVLEVTLKKYFNYKIEEGKEGAIRNRRADIEALSTKSVRTEIPASVGYTIFRML
ncbi:hypothetical protein X798_03894 [Onchocerca flexuosa]|uniref:Uncharacterized protein n=1 Tax=Onchocerca flexuosa TaxID=387005 RepID=A0A238BUY8_9BILA|nr:hypothetical protein X798_03894 [Onchocerca flexuosa]